ncbi:MAG: InlB B-repeat-containing protein, partial [Candidatus Methanomethylophilus sp.]|nr:InlB B-repeat-containing protein [Methanomethylophilus sp.]
YITAITIRDTGKPTTTFVPNLLSASYDDTNGYSLYTETAVFRKKADTANTWTYDYYPHGIAIVTVTFAALEYTVTIHTGVDQSGEATYHYGVGHSITIQAPNDTLTHEFTGWATTSTGAVVYTTEIRPGTDFMYGNRVFYEIWEVIKTKYTVTFSSIGGVYAPSMEYEYDPEHPSIVISLDGYTASWANHKFKGWFRDNGTFVDGPVTSFPSSTRADFTLYAKWAEMASFSVYDFVYDGVQHIGVSVYGCTVTSGTDRATQSGDYTATLTLTSGYEWRDTDQIVTKTAEWHITPRPLYLISESVWGSYTGDGYVLRIGSTAFTAIGFVGDDEDDLNITVTGERSSPGITATSISCTAKTGHESTLANYNVQTITGTVIVTEPSVATVTVSNGLQPTSGPAAPAIQAAVNPTGSRRWMI